MSIDEILDDMDDLLDKAAGVPFASHKSIIDGERLRELINDVRLNVPQEIKHAKMVEYDRDRILKEAEARAELIVRQAEERAKQLMSEEAIIREAKKYAAELVNNAKAESDAIKNATDVYIGKRFKEAENFFSTGLQDVQQRKAKLDKVRKNSQQSASQPTASISRKQVQAQQKNSNN